jgi:MFS family permease
MSEAKSERRHEHAVVGLVSSAHCFSHYYIFALPTLLAFMVKDPALAPLHLSFVKAGFVVSAFSLASGTFQFFMGVLADRFGAKRVLFLGLTVLSGCFALLSQSTSYPMMLGLAFAAGIGNSVFHPVDYTIIGANVKSDRLPRAYAIHTFSGYAGFAIGPAVSGLLAEVYGWQMGFLAAGLAGLVMTGLLFLQRRRLAGDAPAKHAQSKGRSAALGFGVVLVPPILMMFLFYVVSGGLSIGLNSAIAAALLKLWHIELDDAARAVSAFMVGAAIGTLVGGTIAARLKRLDLIALIGYSVSSLMMCLIASVFLPYLVVLGVFCLGGFMMGLITPSRDMMVKSLTPAGHSGKVFGFVSSGFEVGGITFAPVFGFMIDHNVPSWVFYTAACLMSLAFLSAFAATRLRRPALQVAAAE